ncbi:MAG: hypothetical protein LC652_13785 [Halomonas sp.]|nr:hypothetical protein [Halomonas sp.]
MIVRENESYQASRQEPKAFQLFEEKSLAPMLRHYPVQALFESGLPTALNGQLPQVRQQPGGRLITFGLPTTNLNQRFLPSLLTQPGHLSQALLMLLCFCRRLLCFPACLLFPIGLAMSLVRGTRPYLQLGHAASKRWSVMTISAVRPSLLTVSTLTSFVTISLMVWLLTHFGLLFV